MKRSTVELYEAMKNDGRLQQHWRRNQPGVDRALESPLIVRTPRELATAVLLAAKLTFEPAAANLAIAACDNGLLEFSKTAGSGGTRLANVLRGKTASDQVAKVAAACSLRFYSDRSGDNPLVRLPWSQAGLDAVATANVETLMNPALRPANAELKARGLRALARLLARRDSLQNENDSDLRSRLLDVPGLGGERADAAGMFGFSKAWPVTDQSLWNVLEAHCLLSPQEVLANKYADRQKAFAPYWQELVDSRMTTPHELAATLYLWCNEVRRFRYRYW